MNDARFVEIEGIGPVLFERSQRASKVSICIRSSKDVRVAIPRGMKFQKAVEFAASMSHWVQKHQAQIRQAAKARQGAESATPTIVVAAAKRKLKTRLGTLAKRHDFTYNRVFIRNQRTRWGSCSVQNNISLNIRLVLLPEQLMDYVILHELTHTRVKNHSAVFWRELDKYVGNGKAEAAKLREYGYGFLFDRSIEMT
jgi:predicted metal-dependent hydrolase